MSNDATTTFPFDDGPVFPVGPRRFGDLSKLATALAKAQSEIEDATKDATNPHFKSRYADLASVRAAVRKPLSDNGIAYVQLVRAAEKSVEVETILIHGESGQSIGETLRLPLQQPTPQAVGSCISYGRRYSLMSIVGIAADDDDGEAATRGGGRSLVPGDWKPDVAAKRKSSAQRGRDGEWDKLEADLLDCQSASDVEKLHESYRAKEYREWAEAWRWKAEERFAQRQAELTGEALKETLADSIATTTAGEPQTRAEYIQSCHEQIANAPDAERLEAWWKSEVHARKRFRLSVEETNALRDRAEERDKEFSAPTPIVAMG